MKLQRFDTQNLTLLYVLQDYLAACYARDLQSTGRKNRESQGASENRAQRGFEAESVPLDAQKLTAGLPQSPRRILASALWGHEGGGAVAETREGTVVPT